MNAYQYLDVQLKIRDPDAVTFTQAFFYGCILNSLASLFGEIGGQTDLEIVKFSSDRQRSVIQVPEDSLQRLRIALTLIGQYQKVPCHFQVLRTSQKPLDFEEDCEERISFN